MLLGKDYRQEIQIVIVNTATINNITLINKKYKSYYVKYSSNHTLLLTLV